MTGQEVTEVYAAGTNQDAEWFGEFGDVHTASAVLTLDGGALAVVSNTRYNARGHDVRLEVSLREHRPLQIEEVRIP